MDMRTTAEELQRVSTRRSQAADAIREAVEATLRAYGAIEDAHRSSLGLHVAHALYGESFKELAELVEHLGDVRELVAELGVALAALHPDQAQFSQIVEALSTAARSGMEQKRLAEWEAQALRSVVIRALAGETPEETEG